MASGKNTTTAKKKPTELYLKVPYHILNIPGLGLCEKVLLAHIYSFGGKGCWQSNATLAGIFMTSSRTIKRWFAKIVRADLVQVKSRKGYYRTIWARSHPDVRAAAELYYRGKKLAPKQDQNCPASRDKTGPASGPDRVLRLGQKCPTTNNTTKKETIPETTAPPSPLPAGGQAPAVLAERKSQAVHGIEEFKKRFGLGKGRRQPLSEQEFDRRRQKQKLALKALG